MSGIELVLTVLGAMVLLSVGVMVTVVLVIRAAVRRIRRQRAASGAALRARARVTLGPQRSVLALRVRLDDAMRSGRAAVEIAAAGGGPSGELPRLFRHLGDEASVLDLQLRLMQSETDTRALAEEVSSATLRVEQVEALVRRLRQTVSSGIVRTSDDALSAIRVQMDREVAALHAGITELQRLNRRDGSAPTGRPATASAVPDEENRS